MFTDGFYFVHLFLEAKFRVWKQKKRKFVSIFVGIHMIDRHLLTTCTRKTSLTSFWTNQMAEPSGWLLVLNNWPCDCENRDEAKIISAAILLTICLNLFSAGSAKDGRAVRSKHLKKFVNVFTYTFLVSAVVSNFVLAVNLSTENYWVLQ